MEKLNIKNVEIKQMAQHRTIYEFKEKNSKNEKLIVEITECYYDVENTNSLSNLWKKHGYTNKLYDNALHVDCFCYDTNGYCWERYNPTTKLSKDKKRKEINFKWLLEVSDKNKEKLLNEIYKRFMEG